MQDPNTVFLPLKCKERKQSYSSESGTTLAVNPAYACIHKLSAQHGDKAIVHIREKEKKSNLFRGHSLFKFEIHLTFKCDIFSFYQFALTEKRFQGSRGGRTPRVVNQLLREELRKPDMLVKKARCLMSGKELTLIVWRNESRGFLREKLVGHFGGKLQKVKVHIFFT